MNSYQPAAELIQAAHHIVIIQADNPDADSLGSALALEHILGDLGKQISLYCSVDMPTYLRYLTGWDRVEKELPKQFDLSIVVDASTKTLLSKLEEGGELSWLATRPCLVLDHHAEVDNLIDFASLTINDPTVSSTGELIYDLAKSLGYKISVQAGECLMTSILGDTQGLTNGLAKPTTYRVMAELIELGVDRTKLEELRRAAGKMPETIFRYKAELIKRTEFLLDNQLALVSLPQAEINEYSPLYNPGPLIQSDILQVENVIVAITFKCYDSGRITASIRCNLTAPIAAELAKHFGGGGHAYAAGFKIEDGRPFNQIKSDFTDKASELLNNLNQESHHETV
jgi:phosphoesterase RecJ-like protein